jgi:ABC-type multidrug transport system fused ATPase/permease subunit
MRLKSLLFKVVLKQDISFFDEQENSIGRLCARLSSDASSMQGAIGNRLIGLIQAATIISLSLAMSFYYLPKMGAVLCLFVPLAICSTMIEGKVLSSSNITEKKAIENAANIAVETLDNIRTVQSLGVQLKFMELYQQSLGEAHR